MADGAATTSQTLDRGLSALRLLAGEPDGLTVTALAKALGTHRAAVYRLLGPLTAHHLVRRDDDGRYQLAAGLVELASGVRPRLQEAADGVLRDLADDLGCTTALTLRDDDEAVVVSVVMPRTSNLHVAYRVGMRHPVTRGAPGIALMAAAAPVEGERPAVTEARARGYATSTGELLVGATGIAAAVAAPGHEAEAAISAVWIDGRDAQAASVPLLHAAGTISAALR